MDLKNQTTETANRLLDAMQERACARNDAGLARKLQVAPPMLSKIRHGRLTVGPTLVLRAHLALEWDVREMLGLLLTDAEAV